MKNSLVLPRLNAVLTVFTASEILRNSLFAIVILPEVSPVSEQTAYATISELATQEVFIPRVKFPPALCEKNGNSCCDDDEAMVVSAVTANTMAATCENGLEECVFFKHGFGCG